MRRAMPAASLFMALVLVLGAVLAGEGTAAQKKAILSIEGMTCGGCPLVIKKGLEGMDGVDKASISYKDKRGEVVYDPEKVTAEEIIKKVEELGFRARPFK